MKILMIGLGSIGQRHLRNLSDYLKENAQFLAYRVRGLQRTFSNTMQIRAGVQLEEEYAIQSYYDLDEALAQQPEVAYVTNITSQHLPCAMKAIQAGCDVFMEKPISDSMEGIRELMREAEKRKRVVFVGFQNRFHPCLNRLRELLKREEFGSIISVQSEVGERLTTMHSYENYADTYMARKDQGGGVIANQQIHELDYLQWIFGKPERVAAFCGKNSSLELSVEDYNDAIFWVNDVLGQFPIYAHGDFFQYPPKRSCKVIFENGWIEVDLLNAKIMFACGNEVRQEEFQNFQRNQMFIDEMKAFLECVKTRKQEILTLEDGVVSLQMACAAKLASKENRIINIDEVKI